jgi:hypothetical protein
MDNASYKLNKYRSKYQYSNSDRERELYRSKIEYYESFHRTLEQKGGSNDSKKKCEITDSDTVIVGDGGSNAFIIITKSNEVYKPFPTFFRSHVTDKKIKKRMEDEENNFLNEIRVYRELTENIINPGISEHYVKWIDDYVCDDVQKLFAKCPETYVEYLKANKLNIDDKQYVICRKKFMSSSHDVADSFRVLQMEHCDYSCADFIEDVSDMAVHDMKVHLDIFFFQIIYTLVRTQEIYPYFIHADLFQRNILGKREHDNNNHYTYELDGMSYLVPQKTFFPKINDFGYTSLDAETQEELFEIKPYKSKMRDMYNILYDVYDGGDLGAKSLMSLCRDRVKNDDNNEDDKEKEQPLNRKLKFIRSYFSTFFDVDTVDEFKKKSPGNMNWDWDIAVIPQFVKEINLREPEDLLKNYFSEVFGTMNTNIRSFGTSKSPNNISPESEIESSSVSTTE